jgi:hypothetical protein
MKMNSMCKILLSTSLALLVTGTFLSCSGNSTKDFYYSGIHPPIKTITISEDGKDYSIESVSGHVIIMFKPDVSHLQAVQYIKEMKGMVIGQTVDIRYYLVYTGSGNESAFMRQMKNHSGVRFVSLNAVEYPCAVAARTSVIDNFYIPHGKKVVYALQECGLKTKVRTYNAGIGDGSGSMLQSEINNDLHSILKDAPDNTPLVINMSFGPAFSDPNVLWTDENITSDEKKSYRINYKEGLKNLAVIASNYPEKDFVIVKAAGNQGLKYLDDEILNELGRELSEMEFNVLNNHFILTGAVDSNDPKYSNTVSKGNYNFLYTAVDISDFKYEGEHFPGTSYAAPRISCFISSAVNDHNITATEALRAVKDITYRNPGQALTQKALEREAKAIAASKPAVPDASAPSQAANSGDDRRNKNGISNSPERTLPQSIFGGNRNNMPQNLLGTKWQMEDKNARSYLDVSKSVLEFEDNNRVAMIHYFASGYIDINDMYKYFYDTDTNKWIMYQTTMVDHFLYKNEEEARANTLKMGVYYFLTVTNNKLVVSSTYGSREEYLRIY